MNDLPTDILESRAADQRRRLHNSVAELKMTMREKLDWRRTARQYSREYFPQAAAAAAVIGLTSGWVFGGIFDHR